MNIQIHPSWKKELHEEFEKEYKDLLQKYLNEGQDVLSKNNKNQ